MDLIQQSLGPNAAPKSSPLKERLKVRSLRCRCALIQPTNDNQSLHDFLTSSPTTVAV